MKRIFTLISCCVLAFGAYAQENYTLFNAEDRNFKDSTYRVEVNSGEVNWAVANPDTAYNCSDSVGMFIRPVTGGGGEEWSRFFYVETRGDSVWDVDCYVPSDSLQGNTGASTLMVDIWTTADTGSTFEVSYTTTLGWPNGRHGTYWGKSSKVRQWHTIEIPFWEFPPLTGTCCGANFIIPNSDSINIFILAFGHGTQNAAPDTFYFDNIRVAHPRLRTDANMCSVVDTGVTAPCYNSDTGTTGPIDTIGIAELYDGVSVDLYPNPAYESLTLSYNFKTPGMNSVVIRDNVGRIIQNVHATRFNSVGVVTETIDISGLKAGVYFVEIKHGSERLIKKVIKS